MERIIIMVIKSVFRLPGWIFHIIKFGKDEKFEKYDENVRYEYLKKLVTIVNRSGGIEVVCKGKELLPTENGYIMFPNHQGLFDTLLFFETHGRPFSAVLKKEASEWILVKQIVRMIQAKAMDRNDLRQSMKVIKEVSEEVKQGRNYIIFPEGTRSRNGNELLDFKNGAFKSAVYAKCPIVPVAIINAYKVFDTHSIKKVRTEIHYLEPLYYESYKQMNTSEIADVVKKRIKLEIEQSQND